MDREPEQIGDEWLVLSAQNGDSAAMESLVLRWQPKLLAHARQVTGRSDAASDVVQEAWLAILRSLYQLRDPVAFRGWAYRIVHARAVDWIRRDKRRREELEKQMHPSPQHESPASDESASNRNAITVAIDKLKPDERLLLRMYYLERMKIREIAAALETPLGTVKYRLFQLRKNLKNLVQGDDHGQK